MIAINLVTPKAAAELELLRKLRRNGFETDFDGLNQSPDDKIFRPPFFFSWDKF
jgi:hypothetical protein